MISDTQWEDLGRWPAAFYTFYGQEIMVPSDLCLVCEGYGHCWPLGADHPFCGHECSECDGTGLVEGEKLDRLNLIMKIQSMLTKETRLDDLKQIADILQGKLLTK